MNCPKCNMEIPGGNSFCGNCGYSIQEKTVPLQTLGLAKTAMILGIVGLATSCLGIGILIGLAGGVCGIIAMRRIHQNKGQYKGEGMAVAGIALGGCVLFAGFIIGMLAMIAVPNFNAARNRSMVARTRINQRTLGVALEAYFVDNNAYPLPDIDKYNMPVVPHILTTPIAYITDLHYFNDQFREKGSVPLGYSADTEAGYIIRSYGPDRKDGNSGMSLGTKLNLSKAWSDEELGFDLRGSGLTYDPSNGVYSSGDIWHRGP